jgi:hypothetical protein
MKHLEYIEDGDRYYLILKNPTQEDKEKFINIAKQMFDVSVEPEILDEMKDINEIPDKVVVEKKNEDKKVQNINVQTKPQFQEKPQPQQKKETPVTPQLKQRKLTVFEMNDFKNLYSLLRKNQLSEKEQQAFKKNAYIFFNKNYFSDETFEKQKELVESLYDLMVKSKKTIFELTESEIKNHYHAIKNYIIKWK